MSNRGTEAADRASKRPLTALPPRPKGGDYHPTLTESEATQLRERLASYFRLADDIGRDDRRQPALVPRQWNSLFL